MSRVATVSVTCLKPSSCFHYWGIQGFPESLLLQGLSGVAIGRPALPYKMNSGSAGSSPLSSGSWIRERIGSNFALSDEDMSTIESTHNPAPTVSGQSQNQESVHRHAIDVQSSSPTPSTDSLIDEVDMIPDMPQIPSSRGLQATCHRH